jgi:hypothetical protein
MHKETIRLLMKFKQNYNSFQELVWIPAWSVISTSKT